MFEPLLRISADRLRQIGMMGSAAVRAPLALLVPSRVLPGSGVGNIAGKLSVFWCTSGLGEARSKAGTSHIEPFWRYSHASISHILVLISNGLTSHQPLVFVSLRGLNEYKTSKLCKIFETCLLSGQNIKGVRPTGQSRLFRLCSKSTKPIASDGASTGLYEGPRTVNTW